MVQFAEGAVGILTIIGGFEANHHNVYRSEGGWETCRDCVGMARILREERIPPQYRFKR